MSIPDLGYPLKRRSLRQPIGKVSVNQVEDAGMRFRPQHRKARAESPALIGHQRSQNFGARVASLRMTIAGGNVVEAAIYGVGNFVGNTLAAVAVTGVHGGHGVRLHGGFPSSSGLGSSSNIRPLAAFCVCIIAQRVKILRLRITRARLGRNSDCSSTRNGPRKHVRLAAETRA